MKQLLLALCQQCLSFPCSFPTDSRTNSFYPYIFPSSKNLFIVVDFTCYHSFWDSKCNSDSCWEEVFDWVISFHLFPLNDLTRQLFSISPLVIPSLPTSPLLPPLLFSLTPKRCFRTWSLITYQSANCYSFSALPPQ